MRPTARRRATHSAAAATAIGVVSMVTAVLVLITITVPGTGAEAAGTRTVHYAGASVTVPSSWPVYDLTARPHTCVRFDRNAVYLGHPGTDQHCPAHLVGRTDAVLVEPYDGTARDHVLAQEGTIQRLSKNKRAMITASYGAGGKAGATALLHQGALAAARPEAAPQAVKSAASPDRAAATAPTPTASPTSAAPAPKSATTQQSAAPTYVVPRTKFRGRGFDTCAAPSLRAMKAWSQSSPYRAVGIYIGGINRACGLGNLNYQWVKTARRYGFHFIPTYVGRQAPCAGFSSSISRNTTVAHSQGTWAAQDSVRAMKALGFPTRSPVYLDMEQYDGNAGCSRAVVAFVTGWSAELHRKGFVSGFYSSRLDDMIRTRYKTHPDAVWIARWDGRNRVYGISGIADKLWNRHRRIHQYSGNVNDRFGGVSINIDRDAVDGPVG